MLNHLLQEALSAFGLNSDRPLADAGFVLGLLEALAFHADTWPKEAWFADRLVRWSDGMLRPFVAGKPLLVQR